MNIHQAIQEAKSLLKEKNIKSLDLDIQILMTKVLKKDRKFIILNPKKEISNESLEYFKNLVTKRSKGEPVAYLVKKKYFWKYEFIVSKDVLIPRPDTELIVEQVLKLTRNRQRLSLLDIGIGSGCILLSILKDKKNFYGTGIDISKKTLNICKINSQNLDITNRLKLFKSDIDNFHFGKYDLIISNPPYIKKNEIKYLDRDIVGFEPLRALDGGVDGLS